MTAASFRIGVDIGGTKTAAGLVSADGTVVARHECPTQTDSFAGLLADIGQLIGPWLPQADSIGLCAPGYLDPRSGRITLASNVPALTGADPAGELSRLTGRPARLGNDADAAALAEFRVGAARDWDSVFYLTVSTGIGGGFVGSQGVLTGHSGAASELGHLVVVPGGRPCGCGNRGCLEMYASGTALAAAAPPGHGAREVLAAWRAGEDAAGAAVAEAVDALARGLAAVTQLLDPEGIVFGGSVAVNNPDFMEAVGRALRQYLQNRRPPLLRLAELGTDAGIVGAALLAAGRNG